MKIIEALKKLKDLARKADDIKKLVKDHCAISSLEEEKYPNQSTKVSEWVQSYGDLLKEILRIRVAIQKTNIQTIVVIELNGKQVEKSIAEWIHRRRDLATMEKGIWDVLTDRGIVESVVKGPSGDPIHLKIRRFYDPSRRDIMKDALSSEPSIIDSRLEVVNAITDLVE
uniref:Uncharacterized protein n=1 Tax=viral metagenome TaxID=1070528 RepID=A0A6M3J028_9ZZZZ